MHSLFFLILLTLYYMCNGVDFTVENFDPDEILNIGIPHGGEGLEAIYPTVTVDVNITGFSCDLETEPELTDQLFYEIFFEAYDNPEEMTEEYIEHYALLDYESSNVTITTTYANSTYIGAGNITLRVHYSISVNDTEMKENVEKTVSEEEFRIAYEDALIHKFGIHGCELDSVIFHAATEMTFTQRLYSGIKMSFIFLCIILVSGVLVKLYESTKNYKDHKKLVGQNLEKYQKEHHEVV